MAIKHPAKTQPVYVRLTERETGKMAYSGYVTPDGTGTIKIEGLDPDRAYDFVIARPDDDVPKYPCTFTSD